MKKGWWVFFVVLGIFFGVAAWQRAATIEDQREQQALLEAFRSRFVARDIAGLLALFYWQGADAEMQKTARYMLLTDLDYELVDLRINLGRGEYGFPYEVQGQQYTASLPVVGQLAVAYRIPEKMVSYYPIGKRQGRYYLVVGVPAVE